jgi:hypothetical protein
MKPMRPADRGPASVSMKGDRLRDCPGRRPWAGPAVPPSADRTTHPINVPRPIAHARCLVPAIPRTRDDLAPVGCMAREQVGVLQSPGELDFLIRRRTVPWRPAEVPKPPPLTARRRCN